LNAYWKRALALAAGVGLVVLILVKVRTQTVVAALREALPVYLLAALVAYVAFFVLRGLRWKLLLRRTAPGANVVTTSSLSAFGWLVSTFVPMKAGDIARATVLSRRERASLATVVGSVAVERALDVLGLAAVASLGLLAAAVFAHPHLPPIVAEGVAIAWILPLAAIALLLALASVLRRHRERNRLLRFIGRFLDAIDELRRQPRQVPVLLGFTLLVSAAQVAVFVLLFLAFEPAASPALVAAAVPLFLLSFVVAVVPGNIGTYELAFIAAFRLFGFDEARLGTMSIAVHLLTTSIVVVLGFAGFVVDRLTREHAAPEARGARVFP
jgi:uncharacterized protein (TIRG00374 family)